jgi:hypothetical protein
LKQTLQNFSIFNQGTVAGKMKRKR